ncbi:MAG: NAD(+)/NADH kinase [Chloroflexota bacterium]
MALTQKYPERIMVLANAALPQACRLAGEVSSFLRSLGVCSAHGSLNDETDLKALRIGEFDMLIALGGDGSMLRSGHLCAPLDIPLLGINIGHFGFLVELGENEWQEKLPMLLEGEYRLEERMMLQAACIRDGEKGESWDVINEVVVCRGQYVRPIQVSAMMNDSFLTSYIADGLIVATATGSTAYALAAGGPILPPELRNILLMPVAPHLSLDRAIILAEGASVSIGVKTRHEAVVSVDGRDPVIMHNDDQILVTANKKSLKMVRFQDPGYFYRNLTAYMEHNPMTSIKGNEHFVTK